MPRVTVVSMPEHILRAPSLSSPKPKVRKITWKPIVNKINQLLAALIGREKLFLSILAFLLGRVSIMGELSPFGLALFAAVAHNSRERAAAIGLWATAGVLSSGNYLASGVYLFSILLYYRFSDKLTKLHNKMLAVPLFIACSASVGGLIINLASQATLYSILLSLFNSALCLVLTFIFLYGVPVILQTSNNIRQVSSDSLICVIAMLAIAVAGFGNLTAWGYSVRSIFGGLLIMMLALSGGAGLGASVGVAVGLVVGLTENNVPAAISLYALSGLLAGVFRRLGKCAVSLGFILGSVITVLYFGQAHDLTLVLTEISIPAGIFLLLPVKRMTLLQESLHSTGFCEQNSSSAQINEAKAKISNIAEMFTDLAAAFGSIASTSKEKVREEELNRALAVVGERVCGPCAKRSECWEKNFYRTYQVMVDILVKGEAAALTAGNVPQVVKETCIRRAELADAINLVIERNRSMSFWQKKLTDHRQMVTDQMKAASTIISNLAQEIDKEQRSDRELADDLKVKASLLDCHLEGVRITGKKGAGRVEISKLPCSGTKECLNTILPLAASLVQEKLTLHAECGSKGRQTKCKLTMQVASRLSVVTGVASVAKEPHNVCGDTCAVLPLNKGKVALMLSDGMGSGSKAAGESNMAVKFMEKLLAVGFEVDVAVKTVNSLLLLRTPEESFATIDMAVIDTYSGETEFLKVGSSPSFVKRVREVRTINSSSLPIGIIHQIEIDPVKSVVVTGDIVVMVSDGITDVPQRGNERENWVANYLRRIDSTNPQEIADSLLRQAIDMCGGRRRDDMTVLVAKIVEQPNLVN